MCAKNFQANEQLLLQIWFCVKVGRKEYDLQNIYTLTKLQKNPAHFRLSFARLSKEHSYLTKNELSWI